MRERVEAELELLRQGGQVAVFVPEGQGFVVYESVPVGQSLEGLPGSSDVAVPVPGGYPGSAIDLAGLPVGSPLLRRVKGQPNAGVVMVRGQQFQLVSYHPHGNAGGPSWDQTKHGFHTYYDWILTWLSCLN